MGPDEKGEERIRLIGKERRRWERDKEAADGASKDESRLKQSIGPE